MLTIRLTAVNCSPHSERLINGMIALSADTPQKEGQDTLVPVFGRILSEYVHQFKRFNRLQNNLPDILPHTARGTVEAV